MADVSAQQLQRWRVAERTESFAGFMADHRVFGFVLQDGLERRCRGGLLALAETVCQLVLQQRRIRDEGRGNRLDRGGVALRRQMLQREQGAEAESEIWGGVIAENAAELRDRVRSGHRGWLGGELSECGSRCLEFDCFFSELIRFGGASEGPRDQDKNSSVVGHSLDI